MFEGHVEQLRIPDVENDWPSNWWLEYDEGMSSKSCEYDS